MKRAALAVLRARLAGFFARLPRDKADTLTLLAGALLVLAPHALHLPLWVTALCATTLAWRVAITVRGTRLPPSTLLLPLALAAAGGIWLTFHTVLGRDAGVAMLVLLVAFKMLEMRARRDLYVVIFLCFFLLLTTFFYAQGIGTALMMVASVVMLFTAQLSFQFTGAVPPLRRRLWLAGRVVLIAAPAGILLFLVFPRLPGPLWGLPNDAAIGRTGMSDSMSPGNLAHLAQSDATAFRVRFIDPAPAQPQLYWRGVVLSRFDGRTWTQIQRLRPASAAAHPTRGPAVRHEVTLEPSGQRWLYALDLPDAPPQVAGRASAISHEQELAAFAPIDQRVRYEAVSHPNYSLEAGAALPGAARWLDLPDGFNPRALAAGEALRAYADPAQRVKAALHTFRTESFSYTLDPPPLGRHSVDEFLFETRAGFCEHYASAFVVLMRAAGVPARVVTGYQGGELNPVDDFMTVRQSDAHAWAEVWLAGRGWLRVDPTSAVAPERVQRGAASALPRRGALAGLGQLMDFGAGANPFFARIRFEMAALNNGWNQWVLNYSPERQHGVVESIAAALLDWRAFGALLLCAPLLALAHARRVRRRGDPIDALYSALCLQLGRRGLARGADEGPNAYRARLAHAPLAPAQHAAAARFLRLYSAYKYGAQPPPPGLAATLKSLLTKFR